MSHRVLAVLVVAAALCAAPVVADLYLHFPPGSNNKNRERTTNAQNQDRLFDSQNNANGGVSWRGNATESGAPDPVTYYVGSELRVEWTSQHSCGPNGNNLCDLVIQYACDDTMPGLRDGYPIGNIITDPANAGYQVRSFVTTGQPQGAPAQNQQGTTRIPAQVYQNDVEKRNAFYYRGEENGVQYGMHEGIDFYRACKQRERNKGLWIADRNVANDQGATATRQNNGGNGANDNGANGLECPEERDYFPYWAPTPWKDAAVMTNRENLDEYCKMVTLNSQNNNDKYYCNCTQRCASLPLLECNCPPTREACLSNSANRWESAPSHKIDPPACVAACDDRDNHLGDSKCGDDPDLGTAHFKWRIPADMAGKTCVVRVRYNITSKDFNVDKFTSKQNCPANINDATANRGENLHCRTGMLTRVDAETGVDRGIVYPLYDRPYVTLWSNEPKLSIAMDTDQISRTFQDRSYVFRADQAPSDVTCNNIYNLGFRGRRGNIVQAFPSVEHDYVPSRLRVVQGDCVHIQLHGSNFEPNQAGEGYQHMSRANMVQADDHRANFPKHPDQLSFFTPEQARKFTLLGQPVDKCGQYRAGSQNEQNAADNCGKLNASPNRFPKDPKDGLIAVGKSTAEGTYNFVNTRSNDFTNRAMKGQIIVAPGGLSTAAIVGISFGTVAVVGFAGAGLFYFYRRRKATGAVGTAHMG